ncbi:FAD-dependent 2-octaprenylphenol hydroxylase [Pasteurellaceae bacterium HPA106]|uniref:FAD-dependent monooxygenase n=1 Tax=Spirabiliibacterium pneumoniae TaxID=221400 RepID=UPI001AAE026C|nr:FAD-dependent monooxygenase [Spirabiliibacterium pneumoniae]MBE2895798.1 FAD-dependent 2-octaprenylphenol hydroxylase [Spirabiliibacterium pneumoniae]
MNNVDIIIVGGGMVGLALAACLEQSAVNIAIIEPHPPKTPCDDVSCRVSALNLASQKMLHHLGLWHAIRDHRSCSYQRMAVWEKDSFAKIQFDCHDFGLDQLGHIVENDLIRHHLWQKVQQQHNVTFFSHPLKNLHISDQGAVASFDNGEILLAKLVVGADGANSWVRKQCDMPLNFRDYQHHALVCNIRTEQPHAHCARQLFSHDSILALLPLHEPHLCSIVWSQPPDVAAEHLALSEAEFNKALTVASDACLGLCDVVSERRTIALTARFARSFVANRVALIGDAAHTIHPLAGLGVNLGFMDAVALAQEIDVNLKAQRDIGQHAHLRHFERWRKAEAAQLLLAMQGFKSLFNQTNPVLQLLRGVGMNATDRLPMVKQQLMQHALGLVGDLPDMIRQMPVDALLFD